MSEYKYPDPSARNHEKTSKEYGLSYAKFIEKEWLSNGRRNTCAAKYRELEAFKNNEVDINKYKHILGMCDERIWTGMNWKFIPIAPKFVNVIKDGFATDLFKVHTRAMDSISRKERSRFRKKLEDDMLTSDFMREISMLTDTDYRPEYVPESEEELDIHMQLKYKQPREIASELIINQILEYNNWTETKNSILEDLIVKGIGICKVIPDKEYGIVIDRCKPEDIVYSYDPKSSRNKKGCFYFGEIKEYSPSEIIRISNNEISEEDIKNNCSAAKTGDSTDDRLISVLYFCFKTTLDETYKRKKNKLVRKTSDFPDSPEKKWSVARGKYDVWFEGYYIPGTDLIWGYRLMEEMVRPVHNVTRVLPPYVIYQLSTPSIIENVIPFCEDAHTAVLKLRHLIISAKPKGYEINIDAISNVDLGGGVLQPIEILKIYDQTGRLIVSTRKFDEDGRDYSKALQDINNSLGTDIAQIISVYNTAVDMCYEVSGLNRVRDGSAPLTGALVGTQQIALSMSNTATKHILNGILNIEKGVSEVALNRAQQLSIYGDKFAEEIMDAFLEYDEKVTKELASSHKYRFDVIVEIAPDQNEWQAMEANINTALQSGQIMLSDAIDLRTIKNLKLANEWLKILIKKRQKEREANERAMIQQKEMARAQAEIAINNSRMQENQTKMQLLQIQAQTDIAVNNAKIEKTVEGDLLLMRQRHIYTMQEKGLEVQSNAELNRFKEEAKDNRTRIQADQQSRMIFQRQNGTPPEKFDTSNSMPPLTGIPVTPNDTYMQQAAPENPDSIYGQEPFNESGQLTTNRNGTEETTLQPTV